MKSLELGEKLENNEKNNERNITIREQTMQYEVRDPVMSVVQGLENWLSAQMFGDSQ